MVFLFLILNVLRSGRILIEFFNETMERHLLTQKKNFAESYLLVGTIVEDFQLQTDIYSDIHLMDSLSSYVLPSAICKLIHVYV